MRRSRALLTITAGLLLATTACGSSADAVLTPIDDALVVEVPAPPTEADPGVAATQDTAMDVPAEPVGPAEPAAPAEPVEPAAPAEEPAEPADPEPVPDPTDDGLDIEVVPVDTVPGPDAGTELVVIGVSYESFLRFRDEPSMSGDVLATSTALSTAALESLGEAVEGPGGAVWWKVSLDGQEAWARRQYLAVPGLTDDLTDPVAEAMGVLMSDNLETLAAEVVEALAYGDDAEMVIVGEPLAFEGAGGVVTVDVLTSLDGMVRGERLRIEADLAEEPGEGVVFVVLTQVTRTLLCGNAADPVTGQCV